MRCSVILAACVVNSALALNILLGNDDGFGSAQLRQLHDLLKADGHKTVVVAPVDNESGQGGRAVYTDSPRLTTASEFGLVPARAPSLGRDPEDPDIWYYNGTPTACTFVALDYVIPKYYDNTSIDLYTGGPNFGGNLGPFLYTLSGTMGGTYAAIGRNIPGIAFSAANSEQRSYKWINETTKSGHPDPATIQAQLAYTVVSQLITSTKPGERLLPLSYGISVNTPHITSLTNDSCVNPPFVQTRLTGGAFTDSAVFNETKGTFAYGNLLTEGINECVNGDCALPGETDMVDGGCHSAVSVFSIDYDAPTGSAQASIRNALEPVVEFQNKDRWMTIKKLDQKAWEEKAPLRHE